VKIADRALARWRGSSPTLLLAIAAALFVAPAIYVLTAAMLSQQGALGDVTISGALELAIWSASGAFLLAPFAIPRLLRSFARSVQLLLALVVSVGACVPGLVLTFVTGHRAPVRALGAASMLAILGWTWGFRECFKAGRIESIAPRYTTILALVGVISLLFVVFRVASWDRAVESGGGVAASGFLNFVDTTVGIASLSVARPRHLNSAYARPTTEVLSWALLGIPLLGTFAALYWLFAVRRQEQMIATSAHAA